MPNALTDPHARCLPAVVCNLVSKENTPYFRRTRKQTLTTLVHQKVKPHQARPQLNSLQSSWNNNDHRPLTLLPIPQYIRCRSLSLMHLIIRIRA